MRSHSSLFILSGLISSFTLSSRISAPPPAKVSMPAALSRASTSFVLLRSMLAIMSTSEGERPFIPTSGHFSLIALNASS